jgi:MraZ protein
MEAWFLGEFEYTLDAQRRLAIPSQWRRGQDQGARFFLLPGRERSVQVIPGSAFNELLTRLRRVSFADAQASVALATIGSMATECGCDGQGRISLSPQLMEHAGLASRGPVLLLGAVTTIQIWAPSVWRSRRLDRDVCLDVIQAIQERPQELTEILRLRSSS